MNCTICKKINRIPEGKLVILATFGQEYLAKKVAEDLEKAHIIPSWSKVFSKERISEKTNGSFMDNPTFVVELHGIQDIIQLEALYIESICRNNNALTCDIITANKSCEQVLQQLQ